MSESPDVQRAALIEVFHSVQGEGRYTGLPMAFVRVAACPLRCLYCDTPDSYEARATCRVALGRDERREPNPVVAARAVDLAAEAASASEWAVSGPLTVSVTGGEPLLYPGFVWAFGKLLADRGGRLHLETAALDPEALREVLPVVHHVSADWKLPETLECGDPGDEHEACVREVIATGDHVTLDVKIVLTPRVRDDSFEGALERLAPYRDGASLVLQPVTPFGRESERLDPARLAELARRAGRRGFVYRVLPQVHRTLEVE